jgi:tRNA pseudouridine55 synthase
VSAGPRRPRRRLDGVLLLDKPSGLSSNTALQRARRLLGHTGTLDPLASGLLPLCFGEATKFAQFLLDATKAYVATVRFGAETTTGDAEGTVTATGPVTLTRGAIEAALPRFLGRISQVPPRHSALKFEGRAYYDYARKGIEIPRPAREVEILALALTRWDAPDATLEVTCSKGTYVRVLAEDLGRALGAPAHLAALRRTATGGFDLARAISLEALEMVPEAARAGCLLPVATLVGALPRLEVDAPAAARFRQGMAVAAAATPAGVCAVFADGALLGVAEADGTLAAPRRVVVPVPAGQPALPLMSA